MKSTVYFDSKGESGNIFLILFMVRQEMKKQGHIETFYKLKEKVSAAKGYDEALRIIREYVNLVDIGGRNV